MKFHQEDDATAISSWNESDNLSLCTDDMEDLDQQFLRDQPSLTQTLHRSILCERAAMLMQRESSIEYGASNYVDDATAELSRLSLTSDDSQKPHESTEHSAIDFTCRRKMMEWSISVVEFSYPPPSEPSGNCRRKRKHSVETLRVISAAFSYVDRVMARSSTRSNDSKFQVRTRKEYKLLCMISLHLAAKMSGLFSRGDHEYIQDSMLPSTSSDVKKNTALSNSSSTSSICIENTFCPFSNSSLDTNVLVSDEELTETGTLHNSSYQAPAPHKHQPRPFLHLLSFNSLHSLCQGEFTIKDKRQMELSILFTLEWRLNGGLVLEWLGLMLECMIYCQSYGLHELEKVDLELLNECATSQLEFAIMSSRPLTAKPSTLALAAIANVLEDLCEAANNHDYADWMRTFMQVLDMPCRTCEMELGELPSC